jgi:hypothetical protein
MKKAVFVFMKYVRGCGYCKQARFSVSFSCSRSCGAQAGTASGPPWTWQRPVLSFMKSSGEANEFCATCPLRSWWAFFRSWDALIRPAYFGTVTGGGTANRMCAPRWSQRLFSCLLLRWWEKSCLAPRRVTAVVCRHVGI